jgi:hypothetical protein
MIHQDFLKSPPLPASAQVNVIPQAKKDYVAEQITLNRPVLNDTKV